MDFTKCPDSKTAEKSECNSTYDVHFEKKIIHRDQHAALRMSISSDWVRERDRKRGKRLIKRKAVQYPPLMRTN